MMKKTLVKKLERYIPSERIFAACYEEEKAVFLDSSLVGELGRYSVIGKNPYLSFCERDGVCYRDEERLDISFEEAMKAYLKESYEENPTELPLISGAIGYLTYDYGRKFENIAGRHKKEVQMPDAWMIFYDNLIIEDCEKKELYITAKGMRNDPEESISELASWIDSIKEKKENAPSYRREKSAVWQADFEKKEYQRAIRQMIDYIVEGDIYIANMTQQLTVKSEKHPYEVFCYLREHNPSPFGGYFNYGEFQVVSASPERFMQVRDKKVETRPIKGTRKRGQTPEEDAALRQELIDSEKDRSELLMIVDLERNDLNHVCIPGSVQVTEHFAVESYATVFHLVTTITGRLREDKDVIDLIEAAFPGGSITGAPKIRAMEIIDELEHSRRGLYTGSMGYISMDGSCDLNIVIRTAVCQDGSYHLGVGGGITCESETEFEYEETLQKAKAVLEAIYDDRDR